MQAGCSMEPRQSDVNNNHLVRFGWVESCKLRSLLARSTKPWSEVVQRSTLTGPAVVQLRCITPPGQSSSARSVVSALLLLAKVKYLYA